MKFRSLLIPVLAAIFITASAIDSAAATTYTISVAVTGLTGTLVVQDSKGQTLTFTTNTTQTYSEAFASGSTYTVKVKTQPTGQTCTLSSNSTGTITSNITITATCATTSPNYSISVVPSGLTGTLVVQDNIGPTLTFTTNTSQTFSNTYASGSTYSVTVETQPAGQTCTLGSNASGTITSNITVAATCTTNSSSYTISVAVTGLTSGTLIMHDNKNDTLDFTTNNTQTFPTTYASGASYIVTINTQPVGQTCTLSSNATGTITSNITVTATCAKTVFYKLSVAVTGLTGTLVVQDSKADTLTFTTNNTQTFTKTFPAGNTYSVTIETQPAGETCTLSSNSSGTIESNITVTATCVSNVANYTISVATTGLTGTLVVQDSQSDQLTFTTNTTETFAKSYASGSTYSVTVLTQPTGQTCTLGSNASGTITSNVTVTATCVTNATYKISVAATGLTGTLVVQDNIGPTLTFTTNNTQTFSNTYASGATYSVSVTTQPTGQSCSLSGNASGTITSNITVTATCVTTAAYTISVAVTGLTGTLVVQDNIGPALTFTTNNTQTFSNTYASGAAYSVTVETQPSGETCTLGSNASGTITSNITVTATCSAANYSLSVAVTGLSGTVVMQDDQGKTLTFTGNSTQTFSNTYAPGATYTVSATSQPEAMSCVPTYSTATINSNTTIEATCATGATRQLGTVSDATTIACQGSVRNGVCQQVTVSCPGIPDLYAYVKTNTPTGTSLGTVLYSTGTSGVSLYDSIFTYGSTAVQNVLNAGFTTVQISWGSPFNTAQTDGWVYGPGGVLQSACRIATLNQWIYTTIQNNTTLPMCATGNSGGAGSIAYALNQYNGTSNLSMVELTSGPPTARLDWGCGCTEGKLAVSCGSSATLGTCFGATDGGIWDPGYNPASPAGDGVCTAAVAGALPPGGLNFFLGDSANAPGAVWDFQNTYVNIVFGELDGSAGIPIGFEWFGNVTSAKAPAAVCMLKDGHTIPDYLDGATQIANDLISMCKIQ